MKKLLKLAILAPAFALAWSANVQAGDFECDADNTPGTYLKDSLLVKEGETCELLDYTRIKQGVKVEKDATFYAAAVTIYQNLQAEEGSDVDIDGKDDQRSVIIQNAQFSKSQFVRLCNTDIGQDLKLDEIGEFFRVGANTVDDTVDKCTDTQDDLANGVSVDQNFQIAKSDGIVGLTRVGDDFQCDDESEVDITGEGVDVEGADDCDDANP